MAPPDDRDPDPSPDRSANEPGDEADRGIEEETGEGVSDETGGDASGVPSEITGEISSGFSVDEAQRVAAEIRAVAESRGEDSDATELAETHGELDRERARHRQRERDHDRDRHHDRDRTHDRAPAPAPAYDREPAHAPDLALGPAPIPAPPRPISEAEPPPEGAERPEDMLSPEELRDAWPLLDLDERVDGLRVLPRAEAEEFFIGCSAADEARLLLHFRPGQRRQWMRLLEPDDVADVIQEAGEEHRATLLELLDAPTRKEVTALLAYAEDEAGGLMSTRYARLRPQMTAGEAISYLQRQARDQVETIYDSYVLDPEQRLLGVASFRDLFSAAPSQLVSEIMETDVVRVTEDMDQETVSRVFADHGFTVIPVVDAGGIMKGIVTVDDIVDVVHEEATEDAQKFGGMEALDLPYLESTRAEMIRKRGRWLTILLLGEMLTATALGFFENDLVPTLALFLPLIISSGGNSGGQASTLVIRAMALGEVRAADWFRVIRRELMIGFALGALLGVFASIRVLVWGLAGVYGPHFLLIGMTVATAVTGCVLWGTLAGSMLPFILRRLGADPANASAPLVATLVDVSGIIIYFSIAKLYLTGVLI